MITRYKAADPSDPTSKAEYKVLAAGAQRYWHGTRAAFEQVKDSIPNNTMICITDDNDAPSDIAPLGSVFAYEGNTAPDGYLFCDGSTFDTSKYPDLYLFLGSDTLPVRGSQYDYSNAQAIAESAFASGYTVPADGLILIPYFQGNSGVTGFRNIYINGTIVGSPYSDRSSTRNVCVQAPVKKGDVVTIDADTSVMSTPSFVPVTKYKLIKAVSNMNKSDASALLAQMAQYIRKQNILSDYEDITISTDSANPTVMRYDGFIYIGTRYRVELHINTTEFPISDHDGVAGGGACALAVRKGDRVYMYNSKNDVIGRVAYYKLRDYSDRT